MMPYLGLFPLILNEPNIRVHKNGLISRNLYFPAKQDAYI